jgi:uncharacterized iron-regulated protein
MRPALLFALIGCAGLAAQSPRPLPALADATRIHDTAADAARSWPELLDALCKRDVVFLGETHVDDTTHRVELHVLEQLLARRQGKVVLSLEMFERDVQGALDDYLAGRVDEATFLKRSRPWHNYTTAYRPLVEAAKAARIPVIAANFPATLRRAFAGGGGKRALDALSPEQRALVPAEVFPASAAYWERVDRAVRGHMGGPGGGGTPEERLWDTQNLWDNAMGDAVARARAAHPESLVLHVAGGFHVAYRDGTVAQFVRRSAGSSFAVVSIAPVAELHVARPDLDRDQADYVVYARTLARDFHDGTWAVSVPAELRYQTHVPDGAADRGWPLLVWLPDRSSRGADALAHWRLALRDEAAVVVVEPPFPEVQDDLAVGGRWAFGDGFRADYARVANGLASIVEYASRRLRVDPERVVVAGAGDGGAAVVWTALYGEWLTADFVAVDPTDLGRLNMEALPDRKPLARSLHVAARDPEDARIRSLIAGFTQVGLTPTSGPTGPVGVVADEVRQRFGLRPLAGRDSAPVRLLQLAVDTPRARDWQELHRLARFPGAVAVVEPGARPTEGPGYELLRLEVGGAGAFPIASFADGSGIPLAGGPFGGTTIVVVPKDASDADRAAWREHEQNKVLKRRSMFANIAIADAGAPAGDAASLAQVVTALRAKGRSRFLIVPAAFCADAATMQALRAQLGDAGAGADVSWLPGLGAELAAARPH